MNLDMDKLLREMARNLGIPRRWLKTKKQVEATRRRSEAAKRGWAKRRANKAA